MTCYADGTIAGTRVRGNALQLYLQLSAPDNRTWRRTIRCDGVVRWQATSEQFFDRALAAHRAPRAAAVRRRARRALVPRRGRRIRSGSRTRCAPPTRRSRARTSSSRTASPSDSRVGYGQLASGPVTLLRRYAGVAEEHGVATHLTVTGPGRNGLALLELGETFVVAERFSAELQP